MSGQHFEPTFGEPTPGEPTPGLPGPLPEGERLLWQGAPAWRSLARRALHTRKLGFYFGLLVAWRAASALHAGEPLSAALTSAAWLALPALAALGLLGLLAWLMARSTVYTLTSRRLVMQIGVALPMTLNIPYRVVERAALKVHADGTGDIPLSLVEGERMSYVILWPHARPWHMARAEPMLRAVPDAAHVGEILAEALTASTGAARTAPAQREEGAGVARGVSLAGAMQ